MWITLYLVLGAYAAGFDSRDRDTVVKKIAGAIVFTCLGVPLALAAIGVGVFRGLNTELQLVANFRFYVLRDFRDKDQQWLGNANMIARHHTGLRGKSWRRLMKKINKVNNYTTDKR